MHPNIYNRYFKRATLAPEDGGGGAAAVTPPPENKGGENNGGDNNAEMPDWFNSKPKAPAEQPNNQNAQPPQPSGQQSDPRKAWSDHVASMGLMQGFDQRDFMQAVQDGDGDKVSQMFGTGIENAYRAAVVTMQKYVTQQLEKVQKDAVESAVSRTSGMNLENKMFESMKELSDPAVAPVARVVLKAAVESGKRGDEALAQVRKYFEHTGGLLNKNRAPESRNGGRGQSYGNGDEELDQDFLALLQGQ